MAYRPYEPFRTDLQPFAAPSDGGRGIANINYALYIAGFFTGITPFIGVVLAYMKRGHASWLVRSHLDWQIRIFWHCIAYGIGIVVLHALVVGLGFLTFGVGLVFLIIPWGLAAWWLVWTIWAIVKGLQRLGRDEPIR
ncbi:DUF4870 family protein [Lichenicoccus sp.]|uniref:DUF4870 family protein n=1 Tax=Lichenicoccus sp. TaxID=2781899 RepID=UPI003D0CF747